MVVEEVNSALSRQAFYKRIYRQRFSPDGNWLVATDSLSYLYLFELRPALQPIASNNERQFKCRLKLDEPIFAMCNVNSKLICGDAMGQLIVYNWEDIVKFDGTNLFDPLCKFNGFPSSSSIPPYEINAISCIDDRYILYGGAGDNAIHMTAIEHPNKIISTFVGHNEYINELAVQSEHVFLSSSEDGTVRLWDIRSKDVHVFHVASEGKLKRSNCGQGVCGLDVEGDFMVCGGDMELAIWHIGSRSVASILECERHPLMRHTVVKMNSNRILAGGNCPNLMQFDYSGRHLTSVKTSLRSIYSIETNSLRENAMTTVAGDSHSIDAFLNFGYVSFSFSTVSVQFVDSEL